MPEEELKQGSVQGGVDEESEGSNQASKFYMQATNAKLNQTHIICREYETTDHMSTVVEVALGHGSHVDFTNIAASPGLSSEEVAAKQRDLGLNELTPPKQTPEIVKFLLHFLNPLMLCLLLAGGLTFLVSVPLHTE